MKIKSGKKGLWERIDDKLFNCGNYLMFNPAVLIYTLYGGIIFFGSLFSYLGYVFYLLAKNGAVGYYFGLGVMAVFDIILIVGFTKVKMFKTIFKDMNVTEMNDLMYGDMVNPIIDKLKGKKNEDRDKEL